MVVSPEENLSKGLKSPRSGGESVDFRLSDLESASFQVQARESASFQVYTMITANFQALARLVC